MDRKSINSLFKTHQLFKTINFLSNKINALSKNHFPLSFFSLLIFPDFQCRFLILTLSPSNHSSVCFDAFLLIKNELNPTNNPSVFEYLTCLLVKAPHKTATRMEYTKFKMRSVLEYLCLLSCFSKRSDFLTAYCYLS